MKRSFSLPIIFFMMAAAVLYSKNRETNFSFEDENKVVQIILSNQDREVQLQKRNQRWWVNDSVLARQDDVLDVLFYLQHLQIKNPTALLPENEPSQQNIVSVQLLGEWTTVKTYQIAQTDHKGLLGKMNNSQQWYSIEIAGNPDVDLFPLLSPNVLAWEPKVALSETPSEIRKIIVRNFENPKRSYTLWMDSLSANLICTQTQDTLKPLPEKVQQYLSYFYNVAFERYALELSPNEVDSLKKSRVAYSITVENKAGRQQQISVYYKPNEKGTDELGRPDTVNSHYCYVQRNNNQHLMLALWIDYDILTPDCHYFTQP